MYDLSFLTLSHIKVDIACSAVFDGWQAGAYTSIWIKNYFNRILIIQTYIHILHSFLCHTV